MDGWKISFLSGWLPGRWYVSFREGRTCYSLSQILPKKRHQVFFSQLRRNENPGKCPCKDIVLEIWGLISSWHHCAELRTLQPKNTKTVALHNQLHHEVTHERGGSNYPVMGWEFYAAQCRSSSSCSPYTTNQQADSKIPNSPIPQSFSANTSTKSHTSFTYHFVGQVSYPSIPKKQ